MRRSEDDKYHIERQQRRLTDALRSYIKHLEPPVHVDDTYEKVLPRIANSDEYKAVSSDEARRSAFEKVIRRLREKDEDARERAKRRDRGSPRRDRDRADRQRNGARNGRSRSPERERNAYEDERRKAISEREKNYRKTSTSAAETLLSESTRDRDRYERSHYERERRERESEREQLYRRRESKAVDELPYGDDRGSGRRRRANSDASEDRRESKVGRVQILALDTAPVEADDAQHRGPGGRSPRLNVSVPRPCAIAVTEVGRRTPHPPRLQRKKIRVSTRAVRKGRSRRTRLVRCCDMIEIPSSAVDAGAAARHVHKSRMYHAAGYPSAEHIGDTPTLATNIVRDNHWSLEHWRMQIV